MNAVLTCSSGVLTEICVAFPALSLIEQGYDVFAITDASGTFAEHTREAAHKRMAQAGVQLLNWAAAAAEIHRDWRRDIAGFGLNTSRTTGAWCRVIKVPARVRVLKLAMSAGREKSLSWSWWNIKY